MTEQPSDPEPGHGNIMRVHEPCAVLCDELQIGEWSLGEAFTYLHDEEAAQNRALAGVAAMRRVPEPAE